MGLLTRRPGAVADEAPSPAPARWAHAKLVALVRRPDTVPVLLIVAGVVLANLPVLSGAVTYDPLQLFAGLTVGQTHQLVPGLPTIDPNAGFITRALGSLVSSDWLHGHIPWWNPYEGLGSPLAGEMQSAAFFPPVLLLTSPFGFVAFRLLLEATAGIATYLLVRTLGLRRAPAIAAGLAFGLCGILAWFSHAPANPVPFLPLTLLGVERCRQAAVTGRRRGWGVLAVSGALSVLAGFPEVAYIDGLLVAMWAVVRLAKLPQWRPMLAKLAAGVGVGALLAAPAAVAFVDYLPHSDIGGHSGAFGRYALVPQALVQMLLPYGLGPVFALHDQARPGLMTAIWGDTGGYLTATLAVCALIGLWGRRLRPLRIALAAWTFLGLAKTFGLPPVAGAMTHLPAFANIAFYRYSPASWELAVIVLAALGIDDLAGRRVRRGQLAAAGGTVLALVAWAGTTSWSILSHVTGGAHPHLYTAVSVAEAATGVAVVVVAGLAAGDRPPRSPGRTPPRNAPPRTAGVPPTAGLPGADLARRRRASRAAGAARLAAAAVGVEAVVLFAAPMASAPQPAPVDLGVVHYLQAHLGQQRFVTLGPLAPNFGSMFGLSELDVNDLPQPAAFRRYVTTHLDTNLGTLPFNGTSYANPRHLLPNQQITAHLADYLALGVRYVLVPTPGGSQWPPASLEGRLRKVYGDSVALVYRLAGTAPHFWVSGGPCTVTPQGLDMAQTRCRQPATLHVSELAMAGWTATVDGRSETVTSDGLLQELPVPAGTATVRLSFTPPGGNLAVVAAVVGLALLVVRLPRNLPVLSSRRHHGRCRPGGPPPAIRRGPPVPPDPSRSP